MKFCPKCEAKLRRGIEGLSCPKCEYAESADAQGQQQQQRPAAASAAAARGRKVGNGGDADDDGNGGLDVFDDADATAETRPTIKIECEKCDNTEAVWWMLQTRSADEPTTQFYRCTKCEYTWRDYS